MNEKNMNDLESAIEQYKNGSLTIGQTAKIVGVSKKEMYTILSKRKISVINYPVEDIAKEIEVEL